MAYIELGCRDLRLTCFRSFLAFLAPDFLEGGGTTAIGDMLCTFMASISRTFLLLQTLANTFTKDLLQLNSEGICQS